MKGNIFMFKNTFSIFLIFLVSVTLFSGCGSNPILGALPNKNTDKHIENHISLYIYNAETDKNELINIEIKDNISPKNVVNSYLLEFSKIKYVSTNSIEEKLDKVTIDFNDSVLKLNLGSTIEQHFLNNLADAILQNCPSILEIYVTVNGNSYSTTDIVIDKNKPFKAR
jgi:hypothetical protein